METENTAPVLTGGSPFPVSPNWAVLCFDPRNSEAAREAWGANCGPHAIAAAMVMSLDEVRPHLGLFRGWMNPTMMTDALRSVGVPFTLSRGLETADLCEGINRVQWVGPWLKPGVPARVAYQHTHWVTHFEGWVYCTAADPTRWVPATWWRAVLTLNGDEFFITHHYRMARLSERMGL